MSADELRHVLADLRHRGGDSTLVEVKRATGGCPRLTETLCAFGNMPDGGLVVLGVDEKQGFAIVGVRDVAVLEAGVCAQARTVVPPVQVEFDTVALDGKDVLVARVLGLPSADKPCRTGGRAYLRQADGDYSMSDPEVAQLVALQDRPRYDCMPVERSSTDDLDPDLLHAFLAGVRQSSRRLADEPDLAVLDAKGIVHGTNLALAGLYGLGQYPQKYVPSLSVTAASRPAGAGVRLGDLAHFDGPVPDLLDLSVEWVARNTRQAVVYTPDGHARDQPEIPPTAVRELVSNALVHRDLSPRTQSKSVEIRLLPDRLVITSPGGLWGVSRDQLGTPRGKSAVNEFLYDTARHVRTNDGRRIVESEGGGIGEVRTALREADLPDPVFIDTGVSFTAIIYRCEPGGPTPAASPTPDAVARTSTNAALVWQAIGTATATAADIERRTGLTRRQVAYALASLADAGFVAVDGGQGDRSTTYRRLPPE
ncbi:MAG: putative DNA binding domain-containing protein [Micrococcales bacterium]|nr:putative DNA binding domain-containing protein [Micrococcales bacterium]MCL2666179.1 putative DNA binding domain-containing protein [Micrococcales bacterium]